jgi:hypothetical protein
MTRAFLASLPVGLLRERLDDEWGRADIPDKLERLGVENLGQLAALPDPAISDRFGRLGLVALRMARGEEAPLRPRRVHESLGEGLELGEAISGPQLERVVAQPAAPAAGGAARRRRRLAGRGGAPAGER